MSSEKTLVFEFAWQLLSKHKEYSKLDFEKCVFEKDPNGRFLDLYIEYKSENKKMRIGIEFKFPKKTGKSNSGQTQVRQKVIHDVRRLCILKEQNKIDLGCFLFATNEKCYFTPRKDSKFSTANRIFKKGDTLPTSIENMKEIKVSKELRFNWHTNKLSVGNFAFMDPVFI